MPWPRRLSTLLACLILGGAPPGRAEVSNLAACEEKLALLPDGEDGARCLYDLGRGGGPSRDAAARRLEELHADRPGDPWFGLYLANLRLVKRDPGAEELYRETAELAARRGLPRPEVLARSGLSRLLRLASSAAPHDALPPAQR